jgi:uncharacterized membrane protein (UPF0127 family)
MSKLNKPCFYIIAIGAICVSLSGMACCDTIIIYSERGSETCRVDVELALTPADQAKGLMFRKTMGDHAGMFFVFDQDEIRSFWMRNTLIPLDMVFIDGKLSVVDVHRGAKPLDETVISSRKAARYVLEVNAGKADKCRIKAGSKIKVIKSAL